MSDNRLHIANLPTIQRLPAYLRELRTLRARGEEFVSTTYLSERLQIIPIVVRKDLTVTGAVGKPRIGFSVAELITSIESFLGWQQAKQAFLLGVGHLGTALLGYGGFIQNGLTIVTAFDTNPTKTGTTVHGKTVHALHQLPEMAKELSIDVGILTVPATAAQESANILVRAGIRGIWNFTSAKLDVPETVVCQDQDLSEGLAVLTTRLRRNAEEATDPSAPAATANEL